MNFFLDRINIRHPSSSELLLSMNNGWHTQTFNKINNNRDDPIFFTVPLSFMPFTVVPPLHSLSFGDDKVDVVAANEESD